MTEDHESRRSVLPTMPARLATTTLLQAADGDEAPLP